jgi:hypothetical protein
MKGGRELGGPDRGRDWFLTALGAVVLFRVGVAALLQIVAVKKDTGGLSPFSFGGDDGAYYQAAALRVADGFDVSAVNPFPLAVGEAMRLFRLRSLYVFKFFGVVGSLIAVPLSGLFVNSSKDRTLTARHRAAISLALLPTLAFYTTNSLTRDVWIILGFVAASLALAHMIREGLNSPLVVIFGLAGLVLCTILRPYAGISLVAGSFCWFVLRLPMRFRIVAGTCSALVALALRSSVLAKLSALAVLRQTAYSTGGSSVGVSLLGGSMQGRMQGYLYSFLFNVVGPLPWQVRSPVLAVSFLFDSLPVFLALIVIVRFRHRLASWSKLLLLISFSYLALVALFNDNLGAAGRLRLPASFLLVLVASAVYRPRAEGQPSGDRPSLTKPSSIDLRWRIQ